VLARHTWAVNVSIKDANVVSISMHCKSHGQIHCDRAFANTSFTAYNRYLALDLVHFELELCRSSYCAFLGSEHESTFEQESHFPSHS